MPKTIYSEDFSASLLSFVEQHRSESPIRDLCYEFAQVYGYSPTAVYWKYYRLAASQGYEHKQRKFHQSKTYQRLLNHVIKHT